MRSDWRHAYTGRMMQWVTKRHNERNALMNQQELLASEAEKIWNDLWSAIEASVDAYNGLPLRKQASTSGRRFGEGWVAIDEAGQYAEIRLDRDAMKLKAAYRPPGLAAEEVALEVVQGRVVLRRNGRTIQTEDAVEVLLLPVLFPELAKKDLASEDGFR